jgi:uncharacterized membrane protein YfcA
MDLLEPLLLLLAGMFGGFLSGLLGVGGGIIFVFVLSIYFQPMGLESTELPRYLISNSIFATFFAGLSASIRNWRMAELHLREVMPVALPGAITALTASFFITHYPWYDRQRFTIFFLAMLMFLLVVVLVRRPTGQTDAQLPASPWGLMAIGAVAGLISALSGLGGGLIIVPFLTGYFRISMRRAASISLGTIPVFAVSMSMFYALAYTPAQAIPYSVGYLVMPAALPLGIGVIATAPLGVRLAKRVPNRLIKVMFAALMLVVALKMIFTMIK